MSFSSDCKAEIMAASGELKPCCLSSLIYGELMFFVRVDAKEFSLTQENQEVLEHFVSSLESCGIRPGPGCITRGQKLSTLRITDPEACRRLWAEYGFGNSAPSFRVDPGFFLCGDCARAFMAGAFLAAGSVSDPAKGYHLEFSTHRSRIADGLSGILRSLGFEPRQTLRGYDYVVYFKASEQIEDLLTAMGAPGCSMKVMLAKIEKDVNNRVTRQVNCDRSNARKIADAAAGDILLFTRLLESGGGDLLGEELKEIARLRIEQPVMSISDLAAMEGSGLTKSGMNHRLRKIREIAREYFEHADQK